MQQDDTKTLWGTVMNNIIEQSCDLFNLKHTIFAKTRKAMASSSGGKLQTNFSYRQYEFCIL